MENLSYLKNIQISKKPGQKPRSTKRNIQMPTLFQTVSFQRTSIGETSKVLILLESIEIKAIVVPATLFLSLKLLSRDSC
jgi:hypothetical protein